MGGREKRTVKHFQKASKVQTPARLLGVGKYGLAGHIWTTICFHVTHELGREFTFIKGRNKVRRRDPFSLSNPTELRFRYLLPQLSGKTTALAH